MESSKKGSLSKALAAKRDCFRRFMVDEEDPLDLVLELLLETEQLKDIHNRFTDALLNHARRGRYMSR